MKRIAIIGSGISGLSIANMLKEHEVDVYEIHEASVGGLISCDLTSGNVYHTVGGHVFNSKNQNVLDWFWQYFNKETEFVKATRKAAILLDKKYIGYPIENYLWQLTDRKAVNQIVNELLNIKSNGEVSANNFKDFLIQRFGQTLYELYFKPYNEKIWQTDLGEVSLEWLEGKLPMPNIDSIITSNILQKEESEMVHSTFYYPKINGSQFIVDRLAKDLNFIFHKVENIKRIDDKWLINEKLYDDVVWTGNIKELFSVLRNFLDTEDLDIQKMFGRTFGFKSNGTLNVLCECDKTDLSWLYLPESQFKAHRIIYTGNFSLENTSIEIRNKDRSTCVVEFTDFKSYTDHRDNWQTIPDTIKRLPGNLKMIQWERETNSYVIQNSETRNQVDKIRQLLQPSNFYLLGRFAEWEYYNMDKCIERAMEISQLILNK